MSFPVRAALVAALVALPFAPAAAQSVPAPEASPPPEIGRVVTSDRHEIAPRDAIKSSFVVTKAEMVRRGDATVADALARVPGVSIERSGPLGTLADVTIDGYRTKQVLLLIDGRPAAGAQIELAEIGTIPTTGVTRIEVVEGGGATLYGTGALGGVINIITEGGTGVRSRPRVSLQSDSLGGRALAIENGTVAFERRTSRNAYDYPAVGPVAAGTHAQNADYASTAARVALQGRLGAFRTGFDAGAQSTHLGLPGDAAFPPLSITNRQNDAALDVRARIARDRSDGSTSFEISATRRTVLYTFDANDPAALAFNLFGGTTQVSTEGRVQASLREVREDAHGTTVAGIDLAHGAARVDDGIAPAVLPFAQTALYAQRTIVTGGGARFSAGLRAERDGASGGILAPSLGAKLPLGALVLRANAATGFRAPDITELAYPGFSNPALRPERSRGGDIAVDAPGVLGGATLRWFRQNGNDLVAINPGFDFSSPSGSANPFLINVSRYAIAGFVGSLRTRAFHGFTTSLSLTDTYEALDLTGAARRLARRPVLVADTALEYAVPGGMLASAGILVHAAGPHDTRDTEFVTVDAYARLRVGAGALLSLRARNLGNERYADVSGYPMPGRWLGLELSTR